MKDKFQSTFITSALAAITIAFMDLLGYLPGLRLLHSIHEDYIPMAPSTSICFIILAFAFLYLKFKPRSHKTGIILPAGVLLVSLFSGLQLAGYVIGADLNFEHALVPVDQTLNGIPFGRMSPVTGFAFFLSAMVALLAILDHRPQQAKRSIGYLKGWLCLLVLLIGLTFCLAYFYGVPLLYGGGTTIPMALTTALGFIFLSIVLLTFDPSAFPLSLLTGVSTRSYLLRFMFPLTVFSVIFGYVIIDSSKVLLGVNPGLASAIVVAASIFVTGLVATLMSNFMGDEIERAKFAEELAVEAMCYAEKDYQTLFHEMGEGFAVHEIICDTNATPIDYRFLTVNSAFEAMTGLKAQDVIGRTVLEVLPGTEPSWIERYGKVALTGEPDSFEDYAKEIDKHFEVKAFRAAPNQFACIFTDITDRVKAQNRFSLFKTLIDNSGDSIFIVDPKNGKFLDVNTQAALSLGYSREELLTMGVLDIETTITDQHSWDGHMGEIRREGLAIIEGVNKRKDGTTFPVEVNARISVISGHEYMIAMLRDITERKKSEEALKLAHQILEEVINAIPVRVFWKDRDLVYLGCNLVFACDAGFYDSKDLIGKDDYQMVWREQAELYRADDRQVIESGEPKMLFEESQTTPEGGRIDLLTSKVPMRNSAGEVIGVIGVYMDITERKWAQEALRDWEQQLAGLTNSVPGAIYQFYARPNGEYGLYFVSDQAQEIFGLNIEGGEETSKFFPLFIEHVAPEDRDPLLRSIEESTRAVSFWTFQGRFIRPDGREIYFEGRSMPVQRGDEVLFNGVLFDVTDRVKFESLLIERESRFEQVNENLGEWVWETDKNGMYTYSSSVVEKILGYRVDEIIGKKYFYDFFPPEEKEALKKVILEAIASGKPFKGFINTLVSKSGEKVFVETHAVAIFDKENNIIGYRGSDLDITERVKVAKENQELQAQLQHSQRMQSIGTMANGIAHNFNNILGAVRGFVEMAAADVSQESRVYSDLKMAVKGIEDAKELSNQMLAFSRKMKKELQKVEVAAAVAEAVELFKVSVAGATRIYQNIDPRCGLVFADANEVKQVVMNLCINAYHAIGERGGTISVGLNEVEVDAVMAQEYVNLKKGKYARLTVKDTGCGMDEDTKTRIFEPFFTTKKVGEGTGLGLSVVHGVILSYGGEISFKSRLGEGSTFTIYLPIAEGGG